MVDIFMDQHAHTRDSMECMRCNVIQPTPVSSSPHPVFGRGSVARGTIERALKCWKCVKHAKCVNIAKGVHWI